MRNDLDSVLDNVLGEYSRNNNLDLVDVHVNRTRQSFNIRVLIDKPEGGITLGECSQANKEIREELENKGFLSGNFFLEVCSPGIDRPLYKEADYKRVKGKKLKFILKDEFDKTKELVADLIEVKDNSLVINQNNGEIIINLKNVIKAKQVIK